MFPPSSRPPCHVPQHRVIPRSDLGGVQNSRVDGVRHRIGDAGTCTFLGFAEGFGVGIGAAAMVYLTYGVIDSVREFPPWI
jgi:hypothetical protein